MTCGSLIFDWLNLKLNDYYLKMQGYYDIESEINGIPAYSFSIYLHAFSIAFCMSNVANLEISMAMGTIEIVNV